MKSDDASWLADFKAKIAMTSVLYETRGWQICYRDKFRWSRQTWQNRGKFGLFNTLSTFSRLIIVLSVNFLRGLGGVSSLGTMVTSTTLKSTFLSNIHRHNFWTHIACHYKGVWCFSKINLQIFHMFFFCSQNVRLKNAKEIAQKHNKSASHKGKKRPKSQKIESKAWNFQFAHANLNFLAMAAKFCTDTPLYVRDI